MKEITDESFLEDVAFELQQARQKHAPIHSHHEAYGVIKEEFDEYWEEVKRQEPIRDPLSLYSELVQVAAMAARAAVDCWPEGLE